MSEDKFSEIPIFTMDTPPGYRGRIRFSETPGRATAVIYGDGLDALSQACNEVESGFRKTVGEKGFNAIIGVGYTHTPITGRRGKVIGWSVTMYGHQAVLDPPPVPLRPDSKS